MKRQNKLVDVTDLLDPDEGLGEGSLYVNPDAVICVGFNEIMLLNDGSFKVTDTHKLAHRLNGATSEAHSLTSIDVVRYLEERYAAIVNVGRKLTNEELQLSVSISRVVDLLRGEDMLQRVRTGGDL